MIKVHIGCGFRNFGSEWINVDGANFDHVQSHDIELTHFPDNFSDLIYSAHMLEYMDREQGKRLLQIWFNKLKPGGILRLAVPDFHKMCILYMSCRMELKDMLGPIFGKMRMNSDFIYHKTTYDYKELSEMLREVGFMKIKRYDFNETEHSHIDDCSRAHFPHDLEAIKTGIFTDKHTLISLNIEATKP